MLQNLNFIANAIVFIGTAWLVLSKRVPTHSGSAMVLFILNFAALGNMAARHACHSDPEILSNVAAAIAFCWGFYRVEIAKTWGRRGTIGW